MKNAHRLIVLLVISTSLLLISSPPPARANAQPPFSTISVGDWWKYSLSIKSIGASITLTETLVGSATLLIKGVSTDCYKATLTGSGTFSLSGISGTITESGSGYFRKSDMGSVNLNLTQILTAGFVLTQNIYTNSSIPIVAYQFPMYVGQTWSAAYNTTTVTTTYTSINPIPMVVNNRTYVSSSFNVASESTISVPAGSYDAYDVHSVDSSGYADDYYSPQVENSVWSVNHAPNGTITSSQSLVDFNAWAFQSSLTVSKSGTNYNVGILADATISGTGDTDTTISFQVNATAGTSGRADIAIPKALNSTIVKVFVDNTLQTPTVTSNSTSYLVYFTFGLTTHTVTLQYAPTSTSTALTTYLLYGGIAAAIAIIIIAALLLTRRRAKPPPLMPAPTTAPPPPPPTSPGPSGDQPTSSPN